MKLKLSLFLSLFAIILLYSCDKEETFDDRWKLDNEAQFAKISSSSEYTKINSASGRGYIMYKVLESGESENSPYFTDVVRVRYTGWYKIDWAKADKYNDDKGNVITNKKVFDTTSLSNAPRSFKVNGVVDGFSTALQHMKEGDKWEIWIPSDLAYGDTGSGDIPGYTTLVFEIELVEIVE
ncbi:MAG: FKBP-type peptidyl-prolyl cis-trans isomerase [Fermentimonas sp.]|nr:FKBP-type peptidyl-prolyl cis-trans isomerase [Fermentimonas sp.]